jgi:hypothetical protein
MAAENPTTADHVLARLRDSGWSVAVHNDYRQMPHGRYTFWLLTHANGRWVKGEGMTDLIALEDCARQVERYSMGNSIPGPFATRLTENDAKNGWVELGFDTYEEGVRFWRWAEKEIANARR